MSRTKEDIAVIYNTLEAEAGGKSLRWREFLKKNGIPRNEVEKLFGSSPYSKLQQFAGDSPNRLDLQATSLKQIMSDYGQLASEVLDKEGRLPVAAEWVHKGLRPTENGLNKAHGIRWSEFPIKFPHFFADDTAFAGPFGHVLASIRNCQSDSKPKRDDTRTVILDRVCAEIKGWSPAIRRNSEEAYKSELSLHLRNSPSIQAASLDVREERGDSRCDIALGSKVAVELKKAPNQSEYDRCFGQIARHLQTYDSVIVVIFDVPSRDRLEDFNRLVDLYFDDRVRVIRDG